MSRAPMTVLQARAARVATFACMAASMAGGAGLLGGCASGPVAPAWQAQAQAAAERYQRAHLEGAPRAAEAEFLRARAAVAATADAGRVAQVELLRCALEAASLGPAGCPGFEALRAEASSPQRAYADYLAGAPMSAPQAALLPAPQRAVTTAVAETGDLADVIARVEDPLSRLVAAGVALRAGRASPRTLQLAVETAAAQGWRRPLLVWLQAQALQAERAGDAAGAARARARAGLVTGER